MTAFGQNAAFGNHSEEEAVVLPEDGTIVYSAIAEDVQREDEHEESDKPRLWASDIGYCPRKAILRVKGYEPTIDFDLDTKFRFRGGIIYEDDTGKALVNKYGTKNVDLQYVFKTSQWSGKADAVLFADSEKPIIIEHKATGDKWWNYKNNLPKPAHLAQLWLYGQLFYEEQGIRPTLILFYRAWIHWAEFQFQIDDEIVTGFIDGVPTEAEIQPLTGEQKGQAVLKSNRFQLQTMYELASKDPDYLPNRLLYKDDGCTFRGKPSCPMYWHCWEA